MTIRIISRLDVKPPNLVKGIHLEGFRKIGNPADYALNYFEAGADEIMYQDIVASLYGRNTLTNLINETAKNLFIPLTVGGGIRSLQDAESLIRSGCDKVAVNSHAIARPKLLSELSQTLGVQAVVLGIEVVKRDGNWSVMTHGGREHTGKVLTEWIKEAEQIGIGEIFLTSIDQDGTFKGFDLHLYDEARNTTNVSIIAHGGAGTMQQILDVCQTGVNAVAIASVLHYKKLNIKTVKEYLFSNGFQTRI